jgi:hypothetical protein
MKKIVFALFILMSFAVSAEAQKTTKKKTKFYYYPTANVYYDVATSQYAYDSSGTWVYVQTLPTSIELGDNPAKYEVWHDTPDVWVDNKVHKVKYKNGVLKKDKPKNKDKSAKKDQQ